MKRTTFLASLFGFVLPKPEYKKGYCPTCGTKASGPDRPLAVAIDDEPSYNTNIGWMPHLRVNVCKTCGNVFVVEKPER